MVMKQADIYVNDSLLEQLPLEEKKRIVQILSRCIRRETQRDVTEKEAEVRDRMARAACDVFGVDIERFYDSQRPDYVWARNSVASALFDANYTITDIGRILNKNHSTVYNSLCRMADALAMPVMYADVVLKYNEFKKKIK